MAGPRFNRSGKQMKKRPRVKLIPTGRATPNERTPTVGKNKGVRQKIVPGFKGLIKKRKQLIN